jgi:hypothetical protein
MDWAARTLNFLLRARAGVAAGSWEAPLSRAWGAAEMTDSCFSDWWTGTPEAKKYAKGLALAPQGSTQDCGQMYVDEGSNGLAVKDGPYAPRSTRPETSVVTSAPVG